jgi:hypothetical protein
MSNLWSIPFFCEEFNDVAMLQASNGLSWNCIHTQHAVVCQNESELASLQYSANIWSRKIVYQVAFIPVIMAGFMAHRV